MGYLKSIGTSIIYIGTFLAAITFIPGLPPDAKFEEYSFVLPKELTGDLAFNDRLNDPDILFSGQLKGAEAFASYNGELYSGVHGGYVVKIIGDKLIPIVKFGTDCDGIWQESKCGRPLGMKFDKNGALYVCDAYYGIFKVDVKTGKYERLVNSKEPIEGKIPRITNFLDIASNGDIYWSDSSTEFEVLNGLYTFLSNPSGRLIRYNAASKKNQVLVHDLGFANGVALSGDEQFVIVLETLMSRITKYNIRGPKAGKREIFIEGLPGLPDNIHSDNENGFLVSMIVYADSQHPSIVSGLSPHPYIRRMAARLLALFEAPFNCLQSYYPNYYTEAITHYLGGFESSRLSIPDIVLILRIDSNGKIVDAAYNSDKKISYISSAYIHDKYLWLGSPSNEYIARVPLSQAFPNMVNKEKKAAFSESIDQPKKHSIPNSNKQQKPNSRPTTTTPTTTTPQPVESKSSTVSGTKKSSKEQKSSHTDKNIPGKTKKEVKGKENNEV